MRLMQYKTSKTFEYPTPNLHPASARRQVAVARPVLRQGACQPAAGPSIALLVSVEVRHVRAKASRARLSMMISLPVCPSSRAAVEIAPEQ